MVVDSEDMCHDMSSMAVGVMVNDEPRRSEELGLEELQRIQKTAMPPTAVEDLAQLLDAGCLERLPEANSYPWLRRPHYYLGQPNDRVHCPLPFWILVCHPSAISSE